MSVIFAGSRTRGAPKVPLRQHVRGGANFRRRTCRMAWLQLYGTDVARDKHYRPGASSLTLMFAEQGLWALLKHRIASGLYNARLPDVIKRACLYALEVWQKVVEVPTGISISRETRIGPDFYIGHFGQIFIGKGRQDRRILQRFPRRDDR
jgi:hypothetical protein